MVRTTGIPENRTTKSLNKITKWEEQQRNITRYIYHHPDNPGTQSLVNQYGELSEKIDLEVDKMKKKQSKK